MKRLLSFLFVFMVVGFALISCSSPETVEDLDGTSTKASTVESDSEEAEYEPGPLRLARIVLKRSMRFDKTQQTLNWTGKFTFNVESELSALYYSQAAMYILNKAVQEQGIVLDTAIFHRKVDTGYSKINGYHFMVIDYKSFGLSKENTEFFFERVEWEFILNTPLCKELFPDRGSGCIETFGVQFKDKSGDEKLKKFCNESHTRKLFACFVPRSGTELSECSVVKNSVALWVINEQTQTQTQTQTNK